MKLIGMPLKNVCNSIIKNHLTFSILMCTNFKIMEKSLSFSLKTSILIPFYRTSKTICRWFQSKKQKLFLRLPFKIKAFFLGWLRLTRHGFYCLCLGFPEFYNNFMESWIFDPGLCQPSLFLTLDIKLHRRPDWLSHVVIGGGAHWKSQQMEEITNNTWKAQCQSHFVVGHYWQFSPNLVFWSALVTWLSVTSLTTASPILLQEKNKCRIKSFIKHLFIIFILGKL